MAKPKREWWWPQKTDKAWCDRLRRDYPETIGADWDDDGIRDHYADGREYADVWDHLGDARDDWEELANDWIRLKKLAGEHSSAGKTQDGAEPCDCLVGSR